MKKVFATSLIIIMSLFSTSCNDSRMNTQQNSGAESIQTKAFVEREVTMGEAVTAIIDTGENRVSNIRTACSSISGKSLFPGEEFSFNNLTGARSKENGYKYAPVIVDGEKSYGIGGGVCQVSSTIYMAAVNAGLEITEHHAHSERVAYAPEKNDATVVFGVKDFKFINNLNDTLYIYVWVSDEKVFAKIVTKNVEISE